MNLTKIELLAPAKDLACGIAAIDHGADAVYIGAPMMGARAAANNSIEDIQKLVDYAHFYNVKIYVTVNTIIKEEELSDTEQMIWDLYRVGVDALIVQDMGILEMNLPPIPLHASTQANNYSPEKVQFLHKAGFNQVVLARELTLNEIASIHKKCPEVTLEVFVHGALCVSYSGQCYVSEACNNRSANRGACSQFCRLPFTLKDNDGKVIERDKHFLSLKDLNQSERLEDLLDAGARSLKIEGRLKDVSYVKNVTAAYRQELDRIFKHRKEYMRSSSGVSTFTFKPQLDKTFSRDYTNFFLDGRQKGIASFDTPKSLGEEMGYMKEMGRNYFIIAGYKPFHNGDGACYLDENNKLQGFRVNKVEDNKIFPIEMFPIQPKTTIYRNLDHEFEKLLAKDSAQRKIEVEMLFLETNQGFALKTTDIDGCEVIIERIARKELARTPQVKNIERQLDKLGNTPFSLKELQIELSQEWFIPSSVLADMRREATELLVSKRKKEYQRLEQITVKTSHPYLTTELTYLGNVNNTMAAQFYRRHGVAKILPSFEENPVSDAVLMLCRHCIRYEMGWCPTYQKGKSPYKEPYFLVDRKEREFRLEFDCKQCKMKVYKAN